jgi:hypothetical protein
MKRKIFMVLLFALMISFNAILTLEASATNYYVNGETGDDSYNGLYETYQGGSNGPWATLGKANTSVPSGTHTINVAAGTYAETVIDTRNGTSGYRWWKGVSADTVSMQAFSVRGNYIKISGFRFVGTGSASTTGCISFTTGGINHTVIDSCKFISCLRPGVVSNSDVTYVTINNCTFYGTNGPASINMWAASEAYWTITNNDISHVFLGEGGARGMNIIGSNHLISGNYIHDIIYSEGGESSHIDAILFAGPYAASQTGIIVEKNHIYLWQEANSAVATSYGFMIASGNGPIFRNNVVEAWGGYNTGGSGTPQAVKVYNNTFRSNMAWTHNYGGHGINFHGGTGHELKNNIFVNFNHGSRGAHSVTVESGASVTGSNNLFWNDGENVSFSGYTPDATDITNTDPKFLANYTDLHLQSSSPAKDAGATIATVTNDYSGISRPQGSHSDIGAYEYTTLPVPPAPPQGLRVIP